jgi:DNA-binding SARP family transcriptional activator
LARGPKAPLRLYLAGNVSMERADVLVPERRLPGRQGRLAFALLAAERGRSLSHDEIAEVVWNGAPPRAWATALRAIMSKLRGVIAEAGLDDDASIESAFGCYQLRLAPEAWVDLEAASEAIHRAETDLRAGDIPAANGGALVANAIARRPFLAGEEGEWVEATRARLRSIRARALRCRAEIAIGNRDATLAIHDAETVIELERFTEAGYQLLMRAQALAGNHAEALLAYEKLRALLAEEVGANPSPATEAVYLEILRSG